MITAASRQNALRRALEGPRGALLDALTSARQHGLFVRLGALGCALGIAYAALYFWVCDDAYITFRYALNFVEGRGLVYNAGDPVEGYTNFLWTLELALLHGLSGLPFPLLAVSLSLAFTLGTLAVTVGLARRVAGVALRPYVAVLAIWLLASNRHFALWSTSGLETRQFTFLVALGLLLVLRGQSRAASGAAPRPQARARRGASLALAAAALTRPEGLLVGLGVMAWASLRTRWEQPADRRALATLAWPFLAVVGAHFLFRIGYYGDLVPNTFHAKVGRAWPDAGLSYVTALGIDSGLYVTLPLAAWGAFHRRLRGSSDDYPLFAWVALPFTAYVVYLGGDHFVFRPFDLLWPLLAVATAEGVAALGWLGWATARRRRWPRPRTVGRALGAVAAAIALTYQCVIQIAEYAITYDRPLQEQPAQAVLTPESFPSAFLLPGLESIAPLYNSCMAFLVPHAIATPWRMHRLFADQQARAFAPYGEPERRRLPPSCVAAYPYAGIMPFYLTELTVIDTHGLTDRVVARNGMPPNDARIMAHERVPPAGYLEQRGVNLEVLPAATNLDAALDAGRYAVALAPGLWMPFNAANGAWVREAFAHYPLFGRPQWDTDGQTATALVAGRQRHPRLLWSFEAPAGVGDWRLDGAARPRSGTLAGQSAVSGYLGRGFLGTFEERSRGKRRGDQGVGRARSPVFVVEPGDLLHLLVGGGDDESVGVDLSIDGETIHTFRGQDSEVLLPHVFQLGAFAGRRAQLELRDDSTRSWGHLLLDQVAVFGPSA